MGVTVPGVMHLTIEHWSDTFTFGMGENGFEEDYSAFDGILDYGGRSGSSMTGGDTVENWRSLTLANPEIAWFTGGGSLDMEIRAYNVFYSTGAGDSLSDFDIKEEYFIGGTVYVQYTYDPVPEPASLLGLAVGAAVMARRRVPRPHRP